jgi:two-component system cell cycle response regulator
VVLVLDVDRLKSLNDRYGHLTGAEAVRTVGHLIAANVPAPAVACRYGGDEFAIALPDCTLAAGRAAAERLCEAVRDTVPVLAGRVFSAGTLSVSIGGAGAAHAAWGEKGSGLQPDEEGEALFSAADRALYQAKNGGRNQVWLSQEVLGAAS